MRAYGFLVGLRKAPKGELIFWHSEGEPYRSPASYVLKNVVEPITAWAARHGMVFYHFRSHYLRHAHAVEFLKRGCGWIYDLQQRLGEFERLNDRDVP